MVNLMFSVFKCEKKYCDEQCDFGRKLDDYGCETCDCIDPCEHVTCGPKDTCIKGICGRKTSGILN